MNGIELQDREFFAAIQEKREPNASIASAAGDAHARHAGEVPAVMGTFLISL